MRTIPWIRSWDCNMLIRKKIAQFLVLELEWLQPPFGGARQCGEVATEPQKPGQTFETCVGARTELWGWVTKFNPGLWADNGAACCVMFVLSASCEVPRHEFLGTLDLVAIASFVF